MPHDDALVIALDLGGIIFSKILIDTGSITNVLSQEAFESIEHPYALETKETTPFASLGDRTIQPLGTISINACDLELETKFAITRHFIPFDAILGRPWLHEMKVVPSVYHQRLKFVSLTGEKTIQGS